MRDTSLAFFLLIGAIVSNGCAQDVPGRESEEPQRNCFQSGKFKGGGLSEKKNQKEN